MLELYNSAKLGHLIEYINFKNDCMERLEMLTIYSLLLRLHACKMRSANMFRKMFIIWMRIPSTIENYSGRQTCIWQQWFKRNKSMKAKVCITLYICTNATRSQKVPLSMIGSSKDPCWFGWRHEKCKLPYLDQLNAWYDTKHSNNGWWGI